MKPVLLLVILCVYCEADGLGKDDEVTSLPLANFEIRFKHYSGYLNASDTVQLHYWFTESQTNPAKDPLMLWLTGGPGCSSIDALLTELGPFRINDKGNTILENVYAWNKLANVIFLESPQCVGFSIDTTGACNADDDSTAKQNHQALISFLEKFPEYQGRDFYVAGESYAGKYVPTLSVLIANDVKNFPKYQGSLIGNGCMDDRWGYNGYIYFSYYHGLLGIDKWNDMVNTCCGQQRLQDCDFYQEANPKKNNSDCKTKADEFANAAWNSGNDPYNLYAYCAQGNEPTKYESYLQRLMNVKEVSFGSKTRQKRQSGTTTLPPIIIPCTDTRNERSYLNSKEVRSALHIPDTVTQYWTVCSQNLNYKGLYTSMYNQLQTLLNMNKRILIYNGDVDMACNFLSDEWFIYSLNRTRKTDRGPWYYGNNQVAGYIREYDGITFTTVKGGGHFVPTDKPAEALQMVYNFIQNSNNFSMPVQGIDLNPAPSVTGSSTTGTAPSVTGSSTTGAAASVTVKIVFPILFALVALLK